MFQPGQELQNYVIDSKLLPTSFDRDLRQGKIDDVQKMSTGGVATEGASLGGNGRGV